MAEIVTEERVFTDSEGYEESVTVSHIESGQYRIEESLSFFGFGLMLDEGEDEPAPAMGWLLEVEELEDGRLRVLKARPDPGMDYVSGAMLPGGFHTSPEFSRLVGTVTDLGGNWELFAWGVFSCYVPREAAEEAGFDVQAELEAAAELWPQSRRDERRVAIACSSCGLRMWVPVNKGLLRVTCRKCGLRFYYPPVRL